jgi:hypothetical protein
MLIVSGGVACIVLLVNRGFVSWWVGSGQYSGYTLTVLFVVAMLLRHWNTTWIYPLLCFGRERRISVTNLLDGAATAGFSLALIWFLGPRGGPLGAILGVCLISLPGNLFAMATELKVSNWTLLKIFRPWFWRFAIVAVVSGISARFWVPDSFLKLVLGTILIGATYGAIMLPLLLGSALGPYVRPRLSVMRMKLRTFNFGGTA